MEKEKWIQKEKDQKQGTTREAVTRHAAGLSCTLFRSTEHTRRVSKVVERRAMLTTDRRLCKIHVDKKTLRRGWTSDSDSRFYYNDKKSYDQDKILVNFYGFFLNTYYL